MHWLEIKIILEAPQADWVVDLLADVFYTCGVKGVVIDDPLPDPLADWGADALPAATRPAVTGYLPVDRRLEKMRLAIEGDVAALSRRLDFQYEICCRSVAEEDWAEAWKTFFHPCKVSDTLVVKPTWRDYAPAPGEQVIAIDPGMAFGTGTHPTTALCIQLLEKYLRRGQSVLDVGTGSGILLIAADKLGAATLSGVDSDPLSVAVARENLLQNGIDPIRFNLHCGHLADCLSRTHDLVVANILAHVVIALLDDLPRVLAPGGIFICSGIVKARQSQVADKIAACGLDLLDVRVQEEWVAMAARGR